MTLTLEAIEDVAGRLRAGSFVSESHALAMRARYANAIDADPALGVLVAEAWCAHAMTRPLAVYELAWKREPIALAHEEPVPLRAIESAVCAERNQARRSALWDTACVRAQEHFREGRSLIEAVRARAEDLACATPDALLDALGIGAASAPADALLDESEAAFLELDAWSLREVELAERAIDARHRTLRFEDRLRSLAQPRASAQIPMGDRAAACARWIARVGLDRALGPMVDRVDASSFVSEGVALRVEREGERVVLQGASAPSVWGTAQISALVGEGLAAALGQAGPLRERAGRDRLHRAVFSQLGERLLWAPGFVARELGVDPGVATIVSRAAMHGSLVALRRACAESPFARDALAGRSELVVRLRDRMLRALGASVSPGWTVHVAGASIERRAEAQCFAALCEAVLYQRLRDQLDEDWFRNPRAGEVIEREHALMRVQGTRAWLIERTASKDEPEAIARAIVAHGARVREAFERATK